MPLGAPHRLITCILPMGRALPVVKRLEADHGVLAANVSHARGAGRHSPLAHRRVGETPEQDVLTVLVPAAQAEALFAYLYEHSGVSQPHGGLMYMQTLSGATPFSLPELPEEA